MKTILNLLFASNQDFQSHNKTISVFDFIVTGWVAGMCVITWRKKWMKCVWSENENLRKELNFFLLVFVGQIEILELLAHMQPNINHD